jgi:hypothetical protein
MSTQLPPDVYAAEQEVLDFTPEEEGMPRTDTDDETDPDPELDHRVQGHGGDTSPSSSSGPAPAPERKLRTTKRPSGAWQVRLSRCGHQDASTLWEYAKVLVRVSVRPRLHNVKAETVTLIVRSCERTPILYAFNLQDLTEVGELDPSDKITKEVEYDLESSSITRRVCARRIALTSWGMEESARRQVITLLK